MELRDLRFIPMCALRGDNVVEYSPAMPRFDGQSVIAVLNTIGVAAD